MSTPRTDALEHTQFGAADATGNDYKRALELCRQLERELQEYQKTVALVWGALGNPPYGQLMGKTIWECVAEKNTQSHDSPP